MSVTGAQQIVVSIIICTRNRAEALSQTLASLAHVRVPDDMPCELLIVDNGSTDATAQVAHDCRLPDMPVRPLSEPRPGQCHARNTGMAAACGRVILFTDDDVRPPQDWVEGMAGPILRGEADAVAGGVKFAPHLERPFLSRDLRTRMASTEGLDPASPGRMVGANMAFSRAVLARVPAFDPELGPGGLGLKDETLFSLQLLEAGCRLVSAFDVAVEHHFAPDRLERAALLDMVLKLARSDAYYYHHWEHDTYRMVRLRIAGRALRLYAARLRHWGEWRSAPCPPPWEANHAGTIAFFTQYLAERSRPRNYERHGLVKLKHD